jgi:hypothetical protein
VTVAFGSAVMFTGGSRGITLSLTTTPAVFVIVAVSRYALPSRPAAPCGVIHDVTPGPATRVSGVLTSGVTAPVARATLAMSRLPANGSGESLRT